MNFKKKILFFKLNLKFKFYFFNINLILLKLFIKNV